MVATIFTRRPQASRSVEPRQQVGGQPMTLITTLAVGALAGMMLAPVSGSAFASFDAPATMIEGARTTAKTSRLPRATTVSPTKGRPVAVRVPNACVPGPANPGRGQPVAYV